MGSAEDFERPMLEPKGKAYRLAVDWHTDCKGVLKEKIVVPAGFVTDGASVPRFLWPICGDPMANPRIYAAIVHDWIYSKSGEVKFIDSEGTRLSHAFSRKDADTLYRDYQIALGISKVKAYTEYYAIRTFGGSHWRCD